MSCQGLTHFHSERTSGSPPCAPSSELQAGEGDQWKLRLTNSVSREVTEMQKRYLKKDWETQKNKEGE